MIYKRLHVFLGGLLLIASGFLCQNAQAQTTDPEFAQFYYQNGEFEKAILYLEKLMGKNPAPIYYRQLLSSYMELKRFEEAESLIKKQVKRSELPSEVLLDLALLYKRSGEEKKYGKAISDVMLSLPPNRAFIATMGRRMIQGGNVDIAEEMYIRGIELLDGEYNFALELADIYGARGDIAKMVDAYILLLNSNTNNLTEVQNLLIRYLNFKEEPEKTEMVKNSVLKALQKDPNKTIYNEFLVWFFYQVNNFNGALVQLKALDKRFSDTGERIYDFAQIALENQEFDLAINAYDYLITANRDPRQVERSKTGKGAALYKKLETSVVSEPKFVFEVGNYLSSNTDLSNLSDINVGLALNYAQYLLKYKNDPDSAIAVLDDVIKAPGISQFNNAQAKLAMGDILIAVNDIWEASLLFSQVDKTFKEDILGAEAKFRNARISYYSGDFKWAQDQLDVLKNSTSKLISNDALNLSLLITDNVGRDSVEEPLKMFAFAELFVFQNQLDQAESILDSIQILFPGHPLNDEILFEKAEIALKRNDYQAAARYYQEILTMYPTDLLGDDSNFRLASLNESVLNNKEKAMELYENLIVTYPGSMYTVDARKKYRSLRGDIIPQAD